MALKFLNKKGWHTGSLRNIENVWKAEQKHDAEQRKLEELRKQIHEERDRAEFRQLQEQAGLISGQERLEFLYDSGLAVGKGSSSFQALDSLPKTDPQPAVSSSTPAKEESLAPGALFEEKPQSANDAWRKLHSDPLLMIRQREQEALARIKNNPVKMAMIRKSVETKKIKDKDEKKHRKKHRRKKSKHHAHSSSENDSDSEDAALTVEKQRESHHRGHTSEKPSSKRAHNSDEESSEGDTRRKKYFDKEHKDRRPSDSSNPKYDRNNDQQRSRKNDYDSQRKEHSSERHADSRRDMRSYSNTSDKPPRHESNITSDLKYDRSNDQQRSKKNDHDSLGKEYSSERHGESRRDPRSYSNASDKPPRPESNIRRRNPVKLSEEERAARLREMQMDAEVHEEQRWKRLKKAADSDAEEAIRDRTLVGRNFLDAAQKSVYGAEKGGSSTIEESVRRRMHYSQRGSTSDSNAFRRS